MELLGRQLETKTLNGLLAATRGGMSGALVLRGEPGVGLTTLLDYAVASADDMQVLRATGVESELQLPYAGVHQLVAPLGDRIDSLPEPQRRALGTTFGLITGQAPDRFLVGLAVLTLLSGAAHERPLLCVVDDAQWLDQASADALAFTARRLHADYVALVFAVREQTHARVPFAGLPGLLVGGLPSADSRALLTAAVSGRLDPSVRDHLVAESGGNPFALLALAEELTPDELAGATGLPSPLPFGDSLLEMFVGQLRDHPEATQTLLLLAAADSEVSAEVFWRAAESLGISPDAARPAAADRLLRVGDRLVFRHPLLRSTIYAAAAPDERRRIHRGLASATDAELEPDRYAWHLGAAAAGPDEDLAAGLEDAAAHARARGAAAFAAVLLERAARLSPDPSRRGARLHTAAWAELEGGAPDRATALLAEARVLPLGPLDRAQSQRLRGEIALVLGEGADSSALFREAARALEPLDVPLAREAHLAALEAAMYAGRLGGGGTLLEAASAARSAPAPAAPPRSEDLLLYGFAALFTGATEEAMSMLRLGVESLRDTAELRWLALGCLAAAEVWNDEALHALAVRQVQLAREQGALVTLALALDQQAGTDDVLTGRFDVARGRLEEAADISAATGNARVLDHTEPGHVLVAAWSGPAEEARALATGAMQEAVARSVGRHVNLAHYALSVLELGLARYEAALTAARAACEDEYVGIVSYALPELVEAAVRVGEPNVAGSAVERLAGRTLPSGTDWGLGVLARSRALLADGKEADALYTEAIERLARTRAVPQLARAHLVYGEWLRRGRRRRDARAQLAMAYDLFTSLGAHPFAERARIELVATGHRARKRPAPPSTTQLTAQESNIADLVAEGASNADIAAQLFISPRTVEYHLHKIFRKLDITSRTQLARTILEAR